MFHLKILTKTTHTDLAAIQQEITAFPNRSFSSELTGYGFQKTEVQQLLQSKCGICIKATDGFTKSEIKEFITIGNETVILTPKDFSETDLETHLTDGASVVVGRADGFDVFQIKKLVAQGKEKTFVLGGDLKENHFKDYLVAGSSALLKHGDLSPFAITRLLSDGIDRIYIQSAGFSNLRIGKFLEGKAFLIFGKGNLLSQPTIKDYVKKYKSQIFIESDHFNFDIPWIKEMEGLGAVIV